MKNDKIVPGVVLILIGSVILLRNYGLIHFHFFNLIYLLPILIVLLGINLIFGHNKRSPLAVAIKLAVVVAGFVLVLFGDFGKRNGFWNNHDYEFNMDDDDNDDDNDHQGGITKVEGNSEYSTPFTADAKIARLNISGGGAIYTLSDTTDQLFAASTREFKGKYVYNHTQHDSVYILDFKMSGNKGFHFDWDHDGVKKNDKTNTAVFKLNPNPEWEINVKTGATKLDFDLSKFKVRSLDLAGGAADFDVKLGQPLSTTNVTVETGMSSTTISIPTNAACHIKANTGLSSTNFDGFTKKDDGTYETPGFSGASNKLYIKISGGMADFKVKRY
jgi:hypothetical protein